MSRVAEHWENRDVHLVTRELRAFLYTNLCDTYVEYVKQDLQDPEGTDFLPSLLLLHSCVLSSLRLLHPIMPFITEELFQRLPLLPKERRKDSIMLEHYPQPEDWAKFSNPSLGQSVEQALEVVTAVRALRARYDLGKGAKPQVIISSQDQGLGDLVGVVQRLSGCGELLFTEDTVEAANLPEGYIWSSLDDVKIFMEIGKHIDYEKELKKIGERLAKVDRDRVKLAKAHKGKFQHRLSAAVVKERLAELDLVVAGLGEQRHMLQRLKEESDMMGNSS